MIKKPFLIWVATIGILLAPVVFVLRMFVFSEQGIPDQGNTALWLITSIFTLILMIVAYGVWKVRLWGFYALLGLGALTAVLDLYAWLVLQAKFNGWLILDFVAAAVAVALILQEKVRKPYFNPKIRWWETEKRTRVDLPASLVVNGKISNAKILDISATGCFADSDIAPELNTKVAVDISFKTNQLRLHALFVRKSDSPKGIGLKFVDTNSKDKKDIKKLCKDLNSGII